MICVCEYKFHATYMNCLVKCTAELHICICNCGNNGYKKCKSENHNCICYIKNKNKNKNIKCKAITHECQCLTKPQFIHRPPKCIAIVHYCVCVNSYTDPFHQIKCDKCNLCLKVSHKSCKKCIDDYSEIRRKLLTIAIISMRNRKHNNNPRTGPKPKVWLPSELLQFIYDEFLN
jgi:hypothetical protein